MKRHTEINKFVFVSKDSKIRFLLLISTLYNLKMKNLYEQFVFHKSINTYTDFRNKHTNYTKIILIHRITRNCNHSIN